MLFKNFQTHQSTDRFTYLGPRYVILGSDIYSSERSTPEILRRIGLASIIFGRLANVWKRTGLSLQTKIRLYNAVVISVPLYGSETWTHLKTDEGRLQAFHMNCQRRILGIRLVPFCHERLSHKPNWRRRLGNPDLSEATLHFWLRAATNGSDTSPLHTTPGCGHSCRR